MDFKGGGGRGCDEGYGEGVVVAACDGQDGVWGEESDVQAFDTGLVDEVGGGDGDG